ncbi:MAG: glycosyltransferase family 4 protein, partial [Gammaproteobacteria bacterium]|nr:glycosyltransferase family 4 protein [Gammaproteobacteria bacterium]
REQIGGHLSDPAIAQRIVFTGFLSRKQLIWCYQNAVASLSCRSNSVYANFGFPTKLAEYMAAGSPVLATRVGDAEVYLQHGQNARLADPEDPSSIASEMRWMLEHPEERRAMGGQGRATARQHFHYRSHSKSLMAFIADRIACSSRD